MVFKLYLNWKWFTRKPKLILLVGLENLCAVTMYFNNSIHILQPRLPEVRIEQWVRFRFENQKSVVWIPSWTGEYCSFYLLSATKVMDLKKNTYIRFIISGFPQWILKISVIPCFLLENIYSSPNSLDLHTHSFLHNVNQYFHNNINNYIGETIPTPVLSSSTLKENHRCCVVANHAIPS